MKSTRTELISLYTSGSTGKPKEIQVQKKHVENSAKRTLDYLSINSGTILNCLSIDHIGGFMQKERARIAGLKFISLKPAKDPFKNVEIPWSEISLLSLVPYQLDFLLDSYPNELSLCSNILLGGAPVPNHLAEKVRKNNLTNCYETYGMTETLSHIALKNTLTQSQFHVLNGITLKSDERDCLVVSDSELEIEGLVTNDIVKITSPSTFKWLGRHDNVINSGGIKHVIELLEDQISKNSGNYRIMIYSLEHPELGETINLIVESNNPILELTQKEFYLSFLNKYQVPKHTTFIPKFSETATQKILRKNTISKASSYKRHKIT